MYMIRFLVLLLLPTFLFAQVKLEKITLLDNKVSILAPKELTKMTDEMWSLKYQKRTRPMLVLTDKSGEANLIADMTQQGVVEDQLVSFKDFQIAQLKKSKSGFKLLQDGIKTVNGKKVGYFKFITTAGDQKVFDYYFFTIVDGKILFFTFNCIQKLQITWEKTADQIVASLKTK